MDFNTLLEETISCYNINELLDPSVANELDTFAYKDFDQWIEELEGKSERKPSENNNPPTKTGQIDNDTITGTENVESVQTQKIMKQELPSPKIFSTLKQLAKQYDQSRSDNIVTISIPEDAYKQSILKERTSNGQTYYNADPYPTSYSQNISVQPSVTDGPTMAPKKKKRFRSIYTANQLSELEKSFEKSKYINSFEVCKLATQLSMTDLQVRTWFKNRRCKQNQLEQQSEPTKKLTCKSRQPRLLKSQENTQPTRIYKTINAPLPDSTSANLAPLQIVHTNYQNPSTCDCTQNQFNNTASCIAQPFIVQPQNWQYQNYNNVMPSTSIDQGNIYLYYLPNQNSANNSTSSNDHPQYITTPSSMNSF